MIPPRSIYKPLTKDLDMNKSHKPSKKYSYTYSPELARIIFWSDLRRKVWKTLVLVFDASIILSFLYLGSLLDSPESIKNLSRFWNILVSSTLGA